MHSSLSTFCFSDWSTQNTNPLHLIRLAAALVLALCLAPSSALAEDSIAVGSYLRIVTHDAEVVQGVLVDKTPQGYLVRRQNGQVSHIAYVEILAMKEITEQEASTASEYSSGVNPDNPEEDPLSAIDDPRYTAHESSPQDAESVDTTPAENVKATENMKTKGTEPTSADARPPEVEERNGRSVSRSVGRTPVEKVKLIDSPILFAAGFDYTFFSHSTEGTTLDITGLFGGGFNIGYKIKPVNLVPEIGISVGVNRVIGEWTSIAGQGEWDTLGDIDLSDVGEITENAVKVSFVPGLRWIPGMKSNWVLQPYVGVGCQISVLTHDYGGHTKLSHQSSDGGSYTDANQSDYTESSVALALTAGVKIWQVYIEGEFRVGDSQRISVGFQL